VGTALFLIGLLVSLVGWVMVISHAFRESVLWGLGCIFVPFVYLIFAITHWEDSKKGFLIGIGGAAIVLLGVLMTPTRKHVPSPVQEQASVVETTTHATFESINTPPPQPAPAPAAQVEERAQPVFAQVWVDNRTRLYYTKECAHPENAYLTARSAAVSQGFKAANCK
jgi:hypothetical protein